MSIAVDKTSMYQQFIDSNHASKTHAERAQKRVPTGASRSLLLHRPFPFYVAESKGIYSRDLDGNERIDFHNNYTTMIHGHGHPQIIAAAERQMAAGTSFSAPGVQEYELVDHLCQRVQSLEQIVFNNSGSEAVMLALRVARAYTGRNRIGKFEGGYHGMSDFVMVGGHELPAVGDPARVTTPHEDMAGLPDSAAKDCVLIKYNDPEAVREAVAKFGHELAAIIFEPMLFAGGAIPADPEFLRVLREETQKAGIVLICDEVVTLRQAVGGAQGYYGLVPDLTTMAKTIGGGFPIGAVGGQREFMKVLGDPEDGGTVANLGTFSANPVSVTAGLEAMKILDEATISHVNALGDYLREGVQKTIDRKNAPAFVTGDGSLFHLHWTDKKPTDSRGAFSADPDLNLMMFLGMCNRGIQLSMRGVGALSTPMTQSDMDTFIAAFDDTLDEVKANGGF